MMKKEHALIATIVGMAVLSFLVYKMSSKGAPIKKTNGPEKKTKDKLDFNPRTQEVLILQDGSRHIVDKL